MRAGRRGSDFYGHFQKRDVALMWTVEKPVEIPPGWMLVERSALDVAMCGDKFTDKRGRRWTLLAMRGCRRCGVDYEFGSEDGLPWMTVREENEAEHGLVPDNDRREEFGRWMLTPAPPIQSAAAPPQAAPDRRRFSLWPFRRRRD